MTDSFGARQPLRVNDTAYDIFRLDAVGDERVHRLPYTLKILLENLLRHEDGSAVPASDIRALRPGTRKPFRRRKSRLRPLASFSRTSPAYPP